MVALFARAGIDYEQWKAVSRTLLRGDFRPPAAQATASYSLRSLGGWLMMAVVFGMFGMAAAVLVVLNPDVLLTGTLTLTYMTFVVSTSVLTQHGATILSTIDYAILAPRPVSSRTFLAIRLTNVLFHTFLVTTLMAYPPVIAFTLAHGVSAARGVAAATALYACALALTLALVAGYGAILRRVSAARLQRALGYLQMGLGILAYGGFMVVMQTAGRGAISGMAMPREKWLLLLPPAWFASYLEIATGIATAQTWMRAALSIAILAALIGALRGRLGEDYAERLGALPLTATPEPIRGHAGRAPRRAWFFSHAEGRAVSLLVLAHFRHDNRVRLGIFGIVPMVLIYLFMDLGDGGPDLMAMAVLLFPSILTQQLGASDAYRAAWIYAVTPSHTGRLVIALKNVTVAYFLLPFIGLLWPLFAWRYGGDVGRALLHAAMLGLVGHLALQLTMVINPRLPFASPPEKRMGSASTTLWIIVVMIGGNALVVVLQVWVYVSAMRIAVTASLLILLSWLVNRLLVLRASRYSPQPTR